MKSPGREYPSWLELKREKSPIEGANGRTMGNSRPLPKTEIAKSHLTFVSPKEEQGAQADMVFEGTLARSG